MTKMLAVARWEYIEKIKSKAFLISLFLFPLIMVGVSVVPTLLASRPDTESKVIGIIDRSGDIYKPLALRLDEQFKLPNGQPNYLLEPIAVGPSDENGTEARKTADSLVLHEHLEGYVVISSNILSDTTIEYRSLNVGNFKITERLTHAVRDIVVEKKLHARGLDPAVVKELTSPIEMKTIKLSKGGKEEEAGFERVFFTAYGFMMMMFFLVMTSGQLLVRSMLEEKSNRVVEVLMSSCSARDLMAGKIIGLSGLGLTQMAFWAVIGISLSLNFAVALIPAASALVLFLYFIFGYMLFAGIFVAAGAPVSTEQEAQQITSYLVMILVIPIAFAFTVIQNPSSTFVKVLSFIPLLTPSMMAMRIPIQMPSLLEIIGSLLLLACSAVFTIWIAGKIFRTTILSYGKRPSLKELISYVRAQ